MDKKFILCFYRMLYKTDRVIILKRVVSMSHFSNVTISKPNSSLVYSLYLENYAYLDRIPEGIKKLGIQP